MVEAARHRGFAAVPASLLEELGWSVEGDAPAWRLRRPGAPELHLTEGSPFVRFGDSLLQLADAPYAVSSALYVPVQLLLDLLPRRLPELYATGDGTVLRVLSPAPAVSPSGPSGGAPVAGRPTIRETPQTERASPPASVPRRAPPSGEIGASARRVVVIDPGHGGVDPGAMGAGGVREKDVALALARALAKELGRHPELEVHLTRDRDTLVPLWKRGEWGTRVKGERPGIFISLHANAIPSRRTARGFETYFLSDARTDHERRVAENENAPLALERREGADVPGPDLDFILRELRNLDHQHWSSLLAELVQERLGPVHPGPDRGVKQAPLAVITNALMPAVLVEVGFITNREEERLLARSDFQADAARAISEAVLAFFQRYPPGQAASFGGSR